MSGSPINLEQFTLEIQLQEFWRRHPELQSLSEADRQALGNSMIAWLKENKAKIEAEYWRSLPQSGPLGPWAYVSPFETAYAATHKGQQS